jgi:hypothetical protein
MVCFIQDGPLDYLIYYPIIKHLEEKKKEYIVYDTAGKSTVDMIHFLSQHNDISSVVNYGGSHQKMSFAMLCKEYEQKFINLHGEERDNGNNGLSFLGTISRLAYQNYVVSDPARTFLLDEGIETPIGVFECPITHLSRKSQNVEPFDILYISGDTDKIRYHREQFLNKNLTYKLFDYSDGLPEDWKSVYSLMNDAKMIVSDSFIFDKPSRYLNKHFFYLGKEILDQSNLGISTHTVSHKLELHDYLAKSWSKLEYINPKYGLQSLLQLL